MSELRHRTGAQKNRDAPHEVELDVEHPHTPSSHPAPPLTKFSASYVGIWHTIVGSTAFLGALFLATSLHYKKVVKNEFFGYPQEWFPSISSTVGDWYPERNFFQVFIAIALGMRFSIVFINSAIIEGGLKRFREHNHGLNRLLLLCGFLRHLCLAGWVFVTSNDSHPVHEGTMVGYLALTVVYQLGSSFLMSKARAHNFWIVGIKLLLAFLFLVDLGPMIYFYIQHKDRVPGAYTIYAFFEWALVLFDIAFDATSIVDFSSVSIILVDSQGETEQERLKNQRYLETEEKTWEPSTFQLVLRYCSDIYLGYVSWSMLTSLGVCIWFFPLFDMEISGYEVALLASCLTFLNGSNGIRRFFQNQRALALFLSLIGLASFMVPNPSQRLGVIGIGVMIDMLLVTALWWDPIRRDHALVCHLLGLVLFLIVKVIYTTNNPIWPTMNSANGGLNPHGIFVAILAILEVMTRRQEKPHFDKSKGDKVPWILPSIGFGCLLFMTQFLFTDYSVISNWVVTGFPDHGPLPFPWGLAVVFCAIIGINLSMVRWAQHPVWWAVGFLGALALYILPTYMGFAGGLVLCLYVFSVWPVVISNLAQQPPGRTLFVGSVVYILLLLATVWVVAYPFVPLGEYLRERTHAFLYPAMVGIFLGSYKGTPLFSELKKEYRQKMKRRVMAASLFLTLMLLGAGLYRQQSQVVEEPVLPAGAPKKLTVAVWTIHFGYDEEMWFSHQRMVDVLKKTEADIFSLLETDTTRVFMGNRDVIQWMAEDMKMYYDFGPATRNHTWGCAIISRFPILWSEHILLPSPEGELACAIHATLNVYGTPVDFLISHNGNEDHKQDRYLQTKELGRIMKAAQNPIVYAGYVTTNPGSENYKLLVDQSGSKDIDPTDRDRWCQYIVYKGLEKVGYGRVTHGGITDTEIQVGLFLVGTGTDNSLEIPEQSIPASLRLPHIFKGKGVNGHHYHVFDGPKYFGKQKEEQRP